MATPIQGQVAILPLNINVNQLTVSTISTGISVSVSANTNILSTDYTPPQVGKIRLTFASNVSGVLSIVITNGSVTYVYSLNGGSSLTTDSIYTFEIPVSPSYSYNIRYSYSAIVFYQIDFIPG